MSAFKWLMRVTAGVPKFLLYCCGDCDDGDGGGGYRQARACGGALADVWMTSAGAASRPFFVYGGACYFFNYLDPTSETPGTVVSANSVSLVDSCSPCDQPACAHCVGDPPPVINLSLSGVSVCSGCIVRANCNTQDCSEIIDRLVGLNGTHTLQRIDACTWQKILPNALDKRIWTTGNCTGTPSIFTNSSLCFRATRVSGAWVVKAGQYAASHGWGDCFTGTVSSADCATGGTAGNENGACHLEDLSVPGDYAVQATGGTATITIP